MSLCLGPRTREDGAGAGGWRAGGYVPYSTDEDEEGERRTGSSADGDADERSGGEDDDDDDSGDTDTDGAQDKWELQLARLLNVDNDDEEEQQQPLPAITIAPGAAVWAGRSSKCDIVVEPLPAAGGGGAALPASATSRRHCCFRARPSGSGVAVIVDPDAPARHGVYVNGVRVREGKRGKRLQEGDHLLLGTVVSAKTHSCFRLNRRCQRWISGLSFCRLRRRRSAKAARSC